MLDFITGELLLFDKPLCWTSFDLVKRVRGAILRKLNIKKIKVGHAGTLDPLATGLMIICTGASTKKIEQYQNLTKEYEAEILLGATTPSFDLETKVDQTYDTSHLSDNLVNKAVRQFTGTFKQEPPVFSAKFVNGKRAYEFARKGKNVSLKSNQITIYELEIINFASPILKIRVKCSKGTYIRALARDIGINLQTGAYLRELKRTAIGDFSLSKAMTYNDFEDLLKIL